MNNQAGIEKIIKLVLTVAVVLLVLKWCSSSGGSIINLPGGSSGTQSSEDSGGGLIQNEKTGGSTASVDDMDIKDLEREMGIGRNKGSATTKTTTTTTPTTTTTGSPTTSTVSTPLTFKGIPMTGTLTAFGTELVKAGFRNAGNGTYTGDFAGYSGCKITPSGSNPVQEVRVDFPVISDWDALEKAYDSLQASLTQKYGEPKTSKDNNIAVFNLPNGTVTLDADVKDRSTWHVILKYANALQTATTGTLGRNPIDDL